MIKMTSRKVRLLTATLAALALAAVTVGQTFATSTAGPVAAVRGAVTCDGGPWLQTGPDGTTTSFDYRMSEWSPNVYPATGVATQKVEWHPVVWTWNGSTWIATYPGDWSGWAWATSTSPAIQGSHVVGTSFDGWESDSIGMHASSTVSYHEMGFYVAYMWSNGAITYSGAYRLASAVYYGASLTNGWQYTVIASPSLAYCAYR